MPDYKKISQEVAKDLPQEKKRLEILEKIIEKIKAEIPRILIEVEKNKIFEEIKAGIEEVGLKWEDYLGHIKKTEEELRKDWENDALKRAKYGLALNEIAEREKIDVSEEELEKEIKKNNGTA